MIENNRNILSNAIKNMGRRSPKASNWDDIASRLDQLNAGAFSKVKNDLPIRKAPASAWEKVAKGLPPAHFSFLGSLTGKVISGVVIVAAITATYLLLPEKDDKDAALKVEVSNPVERKPEIELGTEHQPNLKTISETQSGSGSENDSYIIKPAKKVAVDNTISDTDNTREKYEVAGSNDNLPLFSQSGIMYADQSIRTTVGMVNSTPGAVGSIEPLPSRYINSTSFKKHGLDSRNERKTKDITPVYFDESRYQMQCSLGAYYAFSLYQQLKPSGMKTPDRLSSYGIELKLEKHKWFLKTGIEYLNWEEKGTYSIDYNQNQLVYQYNYVDSTNINTSSGDITYFTSEREVYDSLPGQLSDEAGYKYRMLNVPVLFGYKIVDQTKFRLSIIGGLGFDIRLSGKQYTPAFNEEGAVITEISSNLQYRRSYNWQLIGGIEFSYYLSRSLELYLEPSYQQYMQPLYSIDNIKGPGSFKMKAGLRFSF